MKKVDSVYLEDIVEAIDKIDKFVEGLSFSEFEDDDRTQFAVFHALEVIGEASNKLSKDFIESNPEFPVRQAIELRNFLIHGYDQIKLDVVWKTIEEDLPRLKDLTNKLL
ncbi:MAG: hypothetical protein AUJ41_04865 [Candidatus Pacebacteria bacterium CG1_02_43_31]|uniref:DUF86 domain-containing protein n=1 Tax=Candidatus Nomurabacteria bacterium CG22_combo_CG10-13_8_21_14_all_32_8 TaxID=1974732 RepID=A0A2H0CG77_9BACT|nr:MAG: hypothetical protein AUJ41_04865 [Candidatus Pacebacteria bacterium CG1_02_43_31]PIP68926.1 MAG: hypothetical protein COW91_02150 [Candidatus Nomurabacteria bacterium CG22_combo_CG10-13_8_21_14_all_32_8]